MRFQLRLVASLIFCVLLSAVLLYRYFHLQVVRHDYYHTQAEANRISLVPVPPSRGLILDRNGLVLAHNYSAYTLEITPSKLTTTLEETISDLGSIIPIAPRDKKRFYKMQAESRDFASFPIRTKLTDEEVARFAAQAWRFPGVEIQARLFRNYPHGKSASHLIGYIGRISDKDKATLAEGCDADGGRSGKQDCRLPNYKGTDHIGKLGLEQSYEHELHGTTGYAEVETDANNRAIRTLRRTDPVAGNNIRLNVDIRFQQYIEQLFNGRRGSLVAIDPRDGGILALVSQPGFDPNLFVDGIDPDSWKALNEDPDHPLTNRATRGTYPPGSTFKPFMAMAALSSGMRTPSQAISDPGYFILPGASHRFRDDKPGGHGMVDMHKSIVVSCDTYYYRLAVDMGIDRIHRELSVFGFGQITGIDLYGEQTGVLPSKEWKKKRFARYPANVQKWYTGDVVSVGIGQGYNIYTPLQLAQATAVLASRGKAFHPHLVRRIEPVDGKPARLVEPRPAYTLQRKKEHWDIINKAMVDVTRAGTAATVARGAKYTFGGKTGTAQVYNLKGAKYNASAIHEKLRDHSWFIAFAPAENPTIALAVIVENGGFGATAAAPLARKAMDWWLVGPEEAGPAVPPAKAEAAGGRPTRPAAAASAATASVTEHSDHAHD